MYKNGYEPKVGDKVRRLFADSHMRIGEEGVVVSVADVEKLVIEGKPEERGYLSCFFDLISRAVRYADGNDAAVGDLVECVRASEYADLAATAGTQGQRFIVKSVYPRKDEIVPGMTIAPTDGSPQHLSHHGVNVDRFKLIARACPYKVGDWVHYKNSFGSGEFKVVAAHYVDNEGWRIRDTEKMMQYNDMFAKDVKPGRLPCPFKVGDWVKTKDDPSYLPECRNRVFQVTKITRDGDGPWIVSGGIKEVGVWSHFNLSPASPPSEPISLADEVRAIIDLPGSLWSRKSWDDHVTSKIVDLINAKSSANVNLIAELKVKVENQAKALSAQQSTLLNNKRDLADAKARIQSLGDQLRDAKAAREHAQRVVDNQCVGLAQMKQEIADLKEIHVKKNVEIERYQNFIHANADYKTLYENLRNKIRGITE